MRFGLAPVAIDCLSMFAPLGESRRKNWSSVRDALELACTPDVAVAADTGVTAGTNARALQGMGAKPAPATLLTHAPFRKPVTSTT
jgi:hypothetical protein